MDQHVRATLLNGGIAVDETVRRLGGSEEFFLEYLGRYAADATYEHLSQAMLRGDREDVLYTCHTLKGVSASLGILPLYRASSAMMDRLREISDLNVGDLFDSVGRAQRSAVSTIRSIA